MEEEENKKISPVVIVLNVFLIGFVICMVFLIQDQSQKSSNPKYFSAQVVLANVFNEVNISSKAGLILDISKNKIIYSKNELTQLSLGSLSQFVSKYADTKEKIKEIGLKQTYFSDPKTAFGSTRDLAILTQYILSKNPKDLDSINTENKNNNEDGNAMQVFYLSPDRPILFVLLGSLKNEEKNDLNKLLKASLEYIAE